MNRLIPVVLCIDVEPDDRLPDPRHPLPWKGYEACFELFRDWRSRFAQATASPPQFSWFYRMDPQVAQVYGTEDWALRQYPGLWRELLARGDELGIHAHAFRWNETRRSWVTEHGDQAWVEHCVRSSLDAYRHAVGKNCESFRFGDRWMNDATLQILEQNGVLFDLTLEPGHPGMAQLVRGETNTGSIPDLREMPSHPYRPSQKNFRTVDADRNAGIWMIPLSSGPVRGGLGKLSLFAFNLFIRLFLGSLNWQDSITLNLALVPRIFRNSAEQLLSAPNHAYLALVLRSSDPLKRLHSRHIQANLQFILRHPLAKSFAFSTPRAALTHLAYL